MMIKKLSLLLVFTMFVSLFTGCASKEASSLTRIKDAGKLVVGTSADYPPYEYHMSVDGKDTIVGFDIDIAKEIAKDIGVELEISDMNFNGLLPSLLTDKIDIVIAGMNPDAERRESVDFSDIYYYATQSVIVRAEDYDSYKSPSDFEGKKVGAQKGSTQEELALTQLTGANVESLDKVPDLVLMLQNKKIDALVLEQPVAMGFAYRNTDLKISEVEFVLDDEESGSAVAVKKDSKELLDAINSTLKRLIESDSITKYIEDHSKELE